jgi:hypothetical protein
MAEVYDNQFTVTLSSGYTAGSGTLSVSAAAPVSVQTGTFRVRLGNTQGTLLKVTAGAATTTWTVTVEANDANASSGATVYGCEFTAGGFSQVLTDRVSSLWGGSGHPSGWTDVAPHNMTGASTPSPYVAADSGHYSAGGYACFDGTSTMVIMSGLPCWTSLDLGSGAAFSLAAYAITTDVSAGFDNRQPKDFQMQGSNNGTTWTTLDTRTGQTAWGLGATRLFSLSSPSASYRYFRLNVTANNGDTSPWTEVNEMYLYAVTGTPFPGGAVGDFYVDYAARVIYGPKAASGLVWPRIGSLAA